LHILLIKIWYDDSVELAIGFLKECGQKLSQVSPRGLDSVFSTLRNLLHQSSLNKRTQYMIEVIFAVNGSKLMIFFLTYFMNLYCS